ncbi:Kae1-associated kinase Bud32 [Geoglobus acetivorans]|uniref:non-specific serine/threonine protein kinase n=1 Tax=Geoglobus acetivorans TaxID=565033 RepID=A0ABZ3H4B9_GEOAI|nr:Kae1-associated kinase Bud32 [Geoglobus acetivorans]
MKVYRGGEAEVRIYDDRVEKVRVPKRYRVRELDESIRKRRTITEARIISSARRAGVPTPIILDVEGNKIVMEKIDGLPAKFAMNEDLCRMVGKCVARLHSAGIIHGDLTPMNLILKGERVYFIDFGLSFYDERLEAKGVDIHVFHEALKAEFDEWKKLWDAFLEGYRDYEKFDLVLERFEEIQLRGRYVEKDEAE